VPRPERRGREEPSLSLTHALVASNLNPSYVDLWPQAKRAWSELAGLEPVLVLVAEPDAVPDQFRADPAVRVFEAIPGLHTAFQAQCIRLLFPALLDGEGVVVSDIDMIPLGRRYLSRPLEHIRESHFLSYRDVLLGLGEIPICYNAARPGTWGDVFGVRHLDDVRARLVEWADGVRYEGVHGGEGWTTDQLVLHRTLLERGRRGRDVWILDDYYTGFRRLERAYVEKWRKLSPAALAGIEQDHYSDFHFVAADSELAHLNQLVVDLAVRARRGDRQV